MRGVVGHELARVAAAGKRDGRRLQPLGRAVGHALLKERLALHAVDPALHHRRPVAQSAHDRLRALDVVLDEIELRQLALGEEQLARIAHAQLVPADVDRGGLSLLRSHCWKDARSCLREPCSSLAARRGTVRRAPERPARRRGRRARLAGGRMAGRSLPARVCPRGDRAPSGAARELLDALDFDARMRSARALIVCERRLHEDTLAGSIAFEIATRARQAGVPAYAVTAREPPRLLRCAHPRPAGDRRGQRRARRCTSAGRKLAELI